ncbi:hypothetical protein EES43_02970 [Streptomyces sp. ADI96-02]|nr:hypothetical protein EES43_02970 [Streptomyces sp. ADI96-02]
MVTARRIPVAGEARGTTTAPPVLTRATDEHVGEPRPVTPPPVKTRSEFDRRLDAYRPDWMIAQMAAADDELPSFVQARRTSAEGASASAQHTQAAAEALNRMPSAPGPLPGAGPLPGRTSDAFPRTLSHRSRRHPSGYRRTTAPDEPAELSAPEATVNPGTRTTALAAGVGAPSTAAPTQATPPIPSPDAPVVEPASGLPAHGEAVDQAEDAAAPAAYASPAATSDTDATAVGSQPLAAPSAESPAPTTSEVRRPTRAAGRRRPAITESPAPRTEDTTGDAEGDTSDGVEEATGRAPAVPSSETASAAANVASPEQSWEAAWSLRHVRERHGAPTGRPARRTASPDDVSSSPDGPQRETPTVPVPRAAREGDAASLEEEPAADRALPADTSEAGAPTNDARAADVLTSGVPETGTSKTGTSKTSTSETGSPEAGAPASAPADAVTDADSAAVPTVPAVPVTRPSDGETAAETSPFDAARTPEGAPTAPQESPARTESPSSAATGDGRTLIHAVRPSRRSGGRDRLANGEESPPSPSDPAAERDDVDAETAEANRSGTATAEAAVPQHPLPAVDEDQALPAAPAPATGPAPTEAEAGPPAAAPAFAVPAFPAEPVPSAPTGTHTSSPAHAPSTRAGAAGQFGVPSSAGPTTGLLTVSPPSGIPGRAPAARPGEPAALVHRTHRSERSVLMPPAAETDEPLPADSGDAAGRRPVDADLSRPDAAEDSGGQAFTASAFAPTSAFAPDPTSAADPVIAPSLIAKSADPAAGSDGVPRRIPARDAEEPPHSAADDRVPVDGRDGARRGTLYAVPQYVASVHAGGVGGSHGLPSAGPEADAFTGGGEPESADPADEQSARAVRPAAMAVGSELTALDLPITGPGNAPMNGAENRPGFGPGEAPKGAQARAALRWSGARPSPLLHVQRTAASGSATSIDGVAGGSGGGSVDGRLGVGAEGTPAAGTAAPHPSPEMTWSGLPGSGPAQGNPYGPVSFSSETWTSAGSWTGAPPPLPGGGGHGGGSGRPYAGPDASGGAPVPLDQTREWAGLIEMLEAHRRQRPFGFLDDPAVLDALAGRLHDRILAHIRRELVVDRERSGFLAPRI